MPPPVPPPPSNEALNGTVIDPLDQWQPGVSRYVHQQVSECVKMGRIYAGFVSVVSLKEEDEGKARREDEFVMNRVGNGGRCGFLIELSHWTKWQKKSLKPIVIVLTKW